MKKGLFTFCIIVLFCSCNQKSPEQIAKERFDQMNAEQLKKEIYIDSLVSVAYGNGQYRYLKQNRLNAIDILERELPTTKPTLDSLRNTILVGNY